MRHQEKTPGESGYHLDLQRSFSFETTRQNPWNKRWLQLLLPTVVLSCARMLPNLNKLLTVLPSEASLRRNKRMNIKINIKSPWLIPSDIEEPPSQCVYKLKGSYPTSIAAPADRSVASFELIELSDPDTQTRSITVYADPLHKQRQQRTGYTPVSPVPGFSDTSTISTTHLDATPVCPSFFFSLFLSRRSSDLQRDGIPLRGRMPGITQ